MNQSLDEKDQTEIRMKVKLYPTAANEKNTYINQTLDGQLVLSIYEKGRKMLLSLFLTSENNDMHILENKDIVLANWSSLVDKEENTLSVMDNEWHHIDIVFHQHKTFTITVNNKLQREKVKFLQLL